MRRWSRWLVLAVAVPAACVDHALPTRTIVSSGRIAFSLGTWAPQVGGLGATAINVQAAYRRSTGERVPLGVSPSDIALVSAEVAPSISLEAGPCIADPLAVADTGSTPGCFLQLQFLLLGDGGSRLDSVVVKPAEPVTRGGSLSLGTLNLGGATVVALTPGTASLLPGDSVSMTVSTRTGTGIAVDRPVTISSSDTTIAVVSAGGRIVARGIGTATISVTGDGFPSQIPVTVRAWNDAEAAALVTNALARQAQGTSGMGVLPFGFEGLALASGLLADEWLSGDTFTQRDAADQRSIPLNDALASALYRHFLTTRTVAQYGVAAYTRLAAASPAVDSLRAHLAQMYFVQGHAELSIAEAFCAGSAFVVIDPNTAKRTFGTAETGDATYARAEATLTAALAHSTAASATTLGQSVALSARVTRARARLNRSDFVGALADASGVPESFALTAAFAGTNFNTSNGIWAMNVSRRGYSLSNAEGGVGLPFRAAADPRLPFVSSGVLSFDGQTPHFQQLVYTTASATAPLVSGREAALIRAESQAATGNLAAAAAELNTLRANALLPILPGPVTIDVVMSERAFWLFGTGRRLPDMRRLIRQYGRNANAVFPSGAYHKNGATYGTDVNFPISDPGQGNPLFTGCIDRGA